MGWVGGLGWGVWGSLSKCLLGWLQPVRVVALLFAAVFTCFQAKAHASLAMSRQASAYHQGLNVLLLCIL